MSQYHPQATKSHLLNRVLPDRYHEEFIAKQKWDMNKPHDFSVDLNDESYYMYLPENYSSDKMHGLFIWIDPSDRGFPQKDWLRVFDDLDIIYVAANNSGNNQSFTARRIPLALHAIHNMTQQYPIDKKRIYVAGFSGGGYTASILAVSYGEYISGAFYTSGAHKLGDEWVDFPVEQSLNKIKNTNKYVFYAGTKERKYWKITKQAYQSYQDFGVKNTLLLNKARRDHIRIDDRWLRKGLQWLDLE